MAVFSGTTGLTQIPFGFLVDRFGAKFILIAGLAVEGIAFSCMGFAPGYPFLVALMFLAGAANGVYHPADYAILSASVSKTRMGRAFSLHTFGGYAGFAVAGPVIIFLNSTIGWSLGLLICGVAGIGTAFVLMLYSRDLKHTVQRKDNVIGSFTSANSKRLTQLSKERNKRSYQVTSAADLKDKWFQGCTTVGISAGASTPDEIINDVIKEIKIISNSTEEEVVYDKRFV